MAVLLKPMGLKSSCVVMVMRRMLGDNFSFIVNPKLPAHENAYTFNRILEETEAELVCPFVSQAYFGS